MDMKAGRIESFDSKSGRGVLRLDEDNGRIAVNFSVDACRGVVPAPGIRVVAGQLGAEPGSGGPFSDTFAMRAAIVEPELSDVETLQTVGISEPMRDENWERKPVLRVPFDASTFPRLATAFREDLVAKLTFGARSPVTSKKLPEHLKLLGGLCDVSRRAYRYRVWRGKPAVGSTFIGGAFADIGDAPWAEGLVPLLQISLEDARNIGLDDQINVFLNAEHEDVQHPSLLPNFIRQQVAGEFSKFHVIKCRPGERVTRKNSVSAAKPLELIDDVAVFPDSIGLQTAYASLGQELPVDVTRFWEIEVRKGAKFRSIQENISEAFPNAAELDADVVLGGFSALHVKGETPFKRLATFSTKRFEWLNEFVEHWDKAALEVSFDGTPRAWMHGSN